MKNIVDPYNRGPGGSQSPENRKADPPPRVASLWPQKLGDIEIHRGYFFSDRDLVFVPLGDDTNKPDDSYGVLAVVDSAVNLRGIPGDLDDYLVEYRACYLWKHESAQGKVYYSGVLSKRNLKFCLYPRTRPSHKEASFDVILYGVAAMPEKAEPREEPKEESHRIVTFGD